MLVVGTGGIQGVGGGGMAGGGGIPACREGI